MMVELSFHGMSGMTQAVGMFVGIDSVLITVVARMGVVCSWVAGGGERDRDRDLERDRERRCVLWCIGAIISVRCCDQPGEC